MKKWFFDLDNKFKVLIHIIVGILFFLITSCVDENSHAIIYLIWLGLLIVGIIFAVWHIQYKKESQNKSSQVKENKDEQKGVVILTESVVSVKIIESTNDLDEYYSSNGKDFVIKYKYKEQLCFCENFQQFDLDTAVSFELEPTNIYDKDTVSVKVKDKKIGYMYKGDCRDILLKCLKFNKYEIKAFICKKDDDEKRIDIKVGFYRELDDKDSLVATLIKTSKKDELTDEKRQEQVDFLGKGERVYLENDFNCEGLLVKSESGYELGELSQSVSEKLLDKFDDIERVFVKVEEIEYIDKAKVKLRIYL